MTQPRLCETCSADISHRWHTARFCSLKCTDEAAIRRGTKQRGRKKREDAKQENAK